MRKKQWFIGILLILLVMITTSCTENKAREPKSRNVDVIIGTRSYASSVAGSYVLKYILDKKGYVSEVEVYDEKELWERLEMNKVNIVSSMWFYDVDYADYKGMQKEVVDLGPNSDSYIKGFIVPSYVDVAFIEKLNFYKYEFDDIIYCLDESDYLFNLSKEATNVYGLDFDIQRRSAKELEVLLKDAIAQDKWIVIAGYTPHYLFDEYSLRFLEDDKRVFGQKQEIHTVANADFIVRNKELKNYISSFYLYEHEMNSLLNLMEGKEDNAIGDLIEEWMNNHQEVIKRLDQRKVES